MLKKGLWILAIYIMIGMLAACGGQGAESELPPGGGEPGNAAESGSGAAPDNDSQPDQDMQQYLRQVTVQLQGPQYLGSGVVWSVEEDVLVIATAAHVTEGNSPMTVQFEQGEPLETRLRYVSEQVDVAFVEVSLQELETQGIFWQVARQDKEVCDQLEAGQALWIMGSIEEAADRTYDGSVTQPWIYLEDFGNYMLLGHAYAIPGVSGGGVFTREGILVGILCGGDDADQIAVLPWSVMEANSP